MNDRARLDLRVQSFNRELDARLNGEGPAQSALAGVDQAALEVACRLAELDLSANSQSRWMFRRRLAAEPLRPSGWNVLITRLTLPTFWAPLLFMTALIFGWLYSNLGNISYPNNQGAAIAYTQTTGASFLPQPVPTPLAPHDPATRAPAVPVSIQISPQNPSHLSPTGAPYAAP